MRKSTTNRQPYQTALFHIVHMNLFQLTHLLHNNAGFSRNQNARYTRNRCILKYLIRGVSRPFLQMSFSHSYWGCYQMKGGRGARTTDFLSLLLQLLCTNDRLISHTDTQYGGLLLLLNAHEVFFVSCNHQADCQRPHSEPKLRIPLKKCWENI